MFDVVFVAPISDRLCRVCAQSIADRHYGRWVFVQTYKSMRVGATLRGRPETGNLQIVHGEIPGSPHRATPTRQNLFRRALPSAPSVIVVIVAPPSRRRLLLYLPRPVG